MPFLARIPSIKYGATCELQQVRTRFREKPDEAPRRGAHDTGREEGLAQRNLLHRRLRAGIVGHCGIVVPGSRFADRVGFSRLVPSFDELNATSGIAAGCGTHACRVDAASQTATKQSFGSCLWPQRFSTRSGFCDSGCSVVGLYCRRCVSVVQ